MVLQPNTNRAKRVNNENAIPAKNDFRTSFHKAAVRRRALTNVKTSKYSVEQAKRKMVAKAPAMVRISVPRRPAAPPIADVEMKDASPPQHATVPVTLPVLLARPDFVEVSKAAIEAIDPELAVADVEYIREVIRDTNTGPSSYKSLRNYTVKDKDILSRGTLPREVTIVVNDMTSVLPTHMLAIHAPKSPSEVRTQVTLFPTHSLIVGVECAKLPPLPASPIKNGPDTTDSKEVTIPVIPLFLHSPQTFPILLEFFYFKRKDLLLQKLLPAPFPPTILDSTENQNQNHEVVAKCLGSRFRVPVLLEHLTIVHGVWKNTCALGVFNDDVWEVLDVAWKVLLMALSVSSGHPEVMESVRAVQEVCLAMPEGEQSETAKKENQRSTTPRDTSPCPIATGSQ